jgi:hypothetical protein
MKASELNYQRLYALCIILEIFLAFFLATLIVLPVDAAMSGAEPLATIFVDPASVTKTPTDVGTNFTVAVNVSGIQDLFGFDINLTWNNSLITFSSLDNTPLNTIWPQGVFEPLTPRVQSGTGFARYAATAAGGSGFTGSGTIYRIVFHIEEASNFQLATLIDFDAVKLSDSHAEAISATVTAGHYTMGAALPEIQLKPGWNMVSFPVLPTNTSVSNIFSGGGFYEVLTWSGTSYTIPTKVEAGRGYWVLVLYPTTLNVTGVPKESYELDLPAGWSMIGSVYNATVSGSSVFPAYYELVTWTGTGYVDAKPVGIECDKGYWALVMTPTHITVQN